MAVEGILVCWTAALFAGRRHRVSLGRSVARVGYLPAWRRADDSGCSKDAEEGNAVTHTPQSVCTRRKHERSCMRTRGRVLRSVLRPVLVNPHYALGATRVVGRASRHHGWANPGNREEPALGSARTDGARLVACHRPQGKAWHVEKRKEVEASVPTRIRELGFGCPHVEVQLQKSIGDVWSQISSAYALQKERTGSSERGPSAE